MIANVNLPAAQLLVAMGVPLHRIKSIRNLYGEDVNGTNVIDFKNPETQPMPSGHVIAARITSENPDEGFKPSSGTVHELNFKSNKNIWGYFSVSASGGLHEYADSQFGHCFSWGQDRQQARDNLAVALKELSIRGDFRTIVEHLVMILEKHEFLSNNLNTGWLDVLIANKEKSDKPDKMLSLVCAALNITVKRIDNDFQSFKTALERGQSQQTTNLKNIVTADLLHENYKYTVTTTKMGPTQYLLELNGTKKEVEVHHMMDEQLLLSVDGLTHTTYMLENPEQYRVVIGNKTVIFDKENDPTLLISPSTGKLLKFLMNDGDHVKSGDPYAEIEVMKMVTTLNVKETGAIHFIKRPGAILENGAQIARLDLDDATQCTTAEDYIGPGFPSCDDNLSNAMNLNQGYLQAKQLLESALDGYCCPDDFFDKFIEKGIDDYFSYLKNPKLPLDEAREVMASIQGRIPPKLEKAIVKLLSTYEHNITSVLAQFPAQKITAELMGFLATVDTKEKDMVELTIQPIVEVCNRYKHGVKGQITSGVSALLDRYLQVEKQFQHGSYDKTIARMRLEHKDDMEMVVNTVFAHTQYKKRNIVITKLLDKLWKHEPRSIKALKGIFQELTDLVLLENSAVVLKARTILIASDKPSFELRYNHTEKMFLDAITKTEDMYGDLQKMINDDNYIFDVLGDFFYHHEEAVRAAALEVYVRRAYTSYELTAVTNLTLGVHPQAAVKFDFLLPQSHPNRQIKNVSSMINNLPKGCQRYGVLTAFSSFEECKDAFIEILSLFYNRDCLSPGFDNLNSFTFDHAPGATPSTGQAGKKPDSEDLPNILNIAIKMPKTVSDDKISGMMKDFCRENLTKLQEKQIRRITFIVWHQKEFPKYFTFRASMDFREDVIYRNVEPALSFQLELNRLKNYDLEHIPVTNHKMHLYLGRARVAGGKEISDYRFFTRAIIRHSDLLTSEASIDYLKNEGEKLMLEILGELEVAHSHPLASKTDGNHIYVNVVPTIEMNPIEIAREFNDRLKARYGSRLTKLKVKFGEIRMAVKVPGQSKIYILRLCISNEASCLMNMHLYKEVTDQQTGLIKFQCIETDQGPWHGLPVSTPYMTKDYLEMKRGQAQQIGTTFVYDFPEMFKIGVKQSWKNSPGQEPPADEDLLTFKQLILSPDESKAIEGKVYPGENTLAMVAWKMTLRTPEYPEGRDIIVISNDITIQIGSFGPKEDMLFNRASELARKLKIPRIYLAANSGARIGVANEILSLIKVAWENEANPEFGFKYIYLTEEDHKKLSSRENKIVHTELIQEGSEKRHKITDVIGTANDIGVENLAAAGVIAGETSQAYEEIVTMSLVTARAIGIGAYLVRLGQRVVQVDNSSIILTGASALNKLLGREIYTSNTQLGGTQIMYNNGVSHATSTNDMEGICCLVKWLSYIPKHKGFGLPITPSSDAIGRKIEYIPPKNDTYDPRWLLAGKKDPEAGYLSGFFDKGSFNEIMAMWARSVVTGRARLGGIPVGCIAVETRPTELHLPADPANPESEAKIVSQAGQVWYPDSSYKTAQAIFDFNHEELPLIVFANWRGFSGGMMDMYDEVVKFGAQIVDALHFYNQPIIIYIPPYAELRGGSWVVIDPTINAKQMEMYADPTSRGGVLEPEGIVSIKIRAKSQRAVMERLDPQMISLASKLRSSSNDTEKASITEKMKKREDLLSPIYHQVAVHFADLHDTPVRMLNKGVIRGMIPWAEARTALYWRLRRRLLETQVITKVQGVSVNLSHGQTLQLVRRWFIEDLGEVQRGLWEKDQPTVEWLQKQVDEINKTTTPYTMGGRRSSSVVLENLKVLRQDSAIHDFKSLLDQCPDLIHEAGMHLVQRMSPQKRADFLEAVKDFKDEGELVRSKSPEVSSAEDD